MNRQQYANLILEKMENAKERLKGEFATPGRVQSCNIDDLLPT